MKLLASHDANFHDDANRRTGSTSAHRVAGVALVQHGLHLALVAAVDALPEEMRRPIQRTSANLVHTTINNCFYLSSSARPRV